MTLHQLRIFATAARHLNVTRTSAELHISQPSVSQQLKLLEEEYGMKLYKKIAQGIELTGEGRLFLMEAKPILLQVEKLKRIFRPSPGEARLLTVGGSHGPSASFLPWLLSIFRETHPHVQLILRTDTSYVMEQLVQNSNVELALITTRSASPSLIYEPCQQVEKVFFTSSTHPWAKQQRLSLAEVAQFPLIVFKKEKSGGVAKILKQIEERGIHPTVVMHCETAEAVKAAVKRGMGLGILYRDLVEPDIKAGDLRIIHVPGFKMHIDSYIIHPKEKPLSANAQDFLTFLREWPKRTKGPLRAA